MKLTTIKIPVELKAKLDALKVHTRQATWEIIQQVLRDSGWTKKGT